MSYLNSVTIIGFVGADPEQRLPHGSGRALVSIRLLLYAQGAAPAF